MHKSHISLHLLLKSIYSCVCIEIRGKKNLYASKIFNINNAVFNLSVQFDLTLEFAMFHILERAACLSKYRLNPPKSCLILSH